MGNTSSTDVVCTHSQPSPPAAEASAVPVPSPTHVRAEVSSSSPTHVPAEAGRSSHGPLRQEQHEDVTLDCVMEPDQYNSPVCCPKFLRLTCLSCHVRATCILLAHACSSSCPSICLVRLCRTVATDVHVDLFFGDERGSHSVCLCDGCSKRSRDGVVQGLVVCRCLLGANCSAAAAAMRSAAA